MNKHEMPNVFNQNCFLSAMNYKFEKSNFALYRSTAVWNRFWPKAWESHKKVWI